MSNLHIQIAGFIIGANIILIAGKRLSHYGNLLAKLSGLGKIRITLRKNIIRYVFFALAIIVTALTLLYFSEHISESIEPEKSFVNTLFLATSTSQSKIAVTLTAMGMRLTNMAIGYLLDSNLFNVFILFLDDVLHTKGHLLKDTLEINALSIYFVMMMTGEATIEFIF